MLALYLVLRAAVLGSGGHGGLASPVPLPLRLLTMAKVVVEYLGLLVVPLHLHMERVVPPATSPLEPSILASVAVIAGLVAAVLALRREARPLGLGLGWFLVALLPVANLVPLSTFIAEHWLYVPGAFLLLAVSRIRFTCVGASRTLGTASIRALTASRFRFMGGGGKGIGATG